MAGGIGCSHPAPQHPRSHPLHQHALEARAPAVKGGWGDAGQVREMGDAVKGGWGDAGQVRGSVDPPTSIGLPRAHHSNRSSLGLFPTLL